MDKHEGLCPPSSGFESQRSPQANGDLCNDSILALEAGWWGFESPVPNQSVAASSNAGRHPLKVDGLRSSRSAAANLFWQVSQQVVSSAVNRNYVGSNPTLPANSGTVAN